jgi:two-component system, OmpR family, alkaline phosphatase synthesis response regulator PhoP
METQETVKPKPRILLVEDEDHLARLLRYNLQRQGFEVTTTPSGREALSFHAREHFDLVILDLMIEELDGFEVARQLRRRDERLPILMLTARSTEEDRVRGLRIGADDYLTKPFHLPELLLRVQRIMQRSSWYPRAAADRHLLVAGYRIDLDSLRGAGPRGPLQLTPLEVRLLEVMTSEPNCVLTRADLLERVWGYHQDLETRTVDNFIARLRKYFESEPDQPVHFVSVRGRGYMYVP